MHIRYIALVTLLLVSGYSFQSLPESEVTAINDLAEMYKFDLKDEICDTLDYLECKDGHIVALYVHKWYIIIGKYGIDKDSYIH